MLVLLRSLEHYCLDSWPWFGLLGPSRASKKLFLSLMVFSVSAASLSSLGQSAVCGETDSVGTLQGGCFQSSISEAWLAVQDCLDLAVPGMKQKVTEIVFGRELSDRGQIDGREEKRSIMPLILFSWHFFHKFPWFLSLSFLCCPFLPLICCGANTQC